MSGVALFRSSTFEKITITAEVALGYLVLTLLLNKINNNKNKNERPEYHGISIPFKSSGLLKTEVPLFSCSGYGAFGKGKHFS